MKVKKKQKNNHKFILALSVLILVLLGYTIVAYFIHYSPFLETKPQQTSSNQTKDIKVNDNPSIKSSAASSNSNINVDPTKGTNEVPTSTTLSLAITDLSQNNGAVNYTANLNDSSQNGSCVAEYSVEGAKPITSTTNAKNGICGPVSIPEVTFSKIGIWTLTLRYYISNTQVVTTKTIEIH